jgi:hypothetical protein
MNRTLKRIIVAFLVAITLLGIGAITFFFWIFGGSCANYYVSELKIPDTDYKAVAFVRNCGALSSFSTHVSILKTGKELKHSDGGNLFACDKSDQIQLSIDNDQKLQIHYDAQQNATPRFVKGNFQFGIELVEGLQIDTSSFDYDSTINLDSLFGFQKDYYKKLLALDTLINSFRHLEYRDGRWCKRIFLDSNKSYVVKANREIFEWTTSGKYALQHNPVSEPVKQFADFLHDFEISTFDWDKNGVAYIGVEDGRYWYRYTNFQKDSDFVGNVLLTDIGYRIIGNRRSKLLILNPYWKFGVTIKK